MGYGNPLVQREVMDGHVFAVMPVREVSDDPDLIALYRARGTRCWWPSHPRGEHRPYDTVTLRSAPWLDGFAACVTLVRPGDDYSVSALWRDDWTFACWYVDIVRPYQRSPIGWDFADHHLDLIVEADGTSWVKDHDDLDAAVDRGELTGRQAAAAHQRLASVADDAHRGAGVFGSAWPDWRPDPGWATPDLGPVIADALTCSPTTATSHLDENWLVTPP